MVQSAVVQGKLERLRKVIKALVDNGHVHTLIFHWFGNYTLQDLVIGASRVRTVAQMMLREAEVRHCFVEIHCRCWSSTAVLAVS